MTDERAPRPGRIAALVALVLLAGVVLWAPRWWENRLYRQAEAIAGVGSPVLQGDVTRARGRIDPGRSRKEVVEAIGRPSFSVGTEGSSTHEIWTYYYADGTMTVNLTDGIVKRISLNYGSPKIPISHRP